MFVMSEFLTLFSDYSKMWEHAKRIRIEGPLLTCKDVEENKGYGARYLQPFSAEFPHFEVSSNMIIIP